MLPTAIAYSELLVGPGVERGLVGPREAERIWDRHLLNSAVVADLVMTGPISTDSRQMPGPHVATLVDLGSGAGLPGMVLAMLLPEIRVVLVEPMARRTAFLAECVVQLCLDNVEVKRGRAEDLVGQLKADVVTARAVARLDRLAVLAAGVAKPGGLVLAIKGAGAAAELAEARPVLSKLGATEVEIVSAGVGIVPHPTTVVRFVTKSGYSGSSRPQKAGKLSH